MYLKKRIPCLSRALLVAALLVLAGNASADPALMQSVESSAAIEAGREAIRDEEFIKAANIFEQAVLANPEDAALSRYLGIGYYKTGRNRQAIELLERALNLSPQDAETHYALGVVYLARASEVSVLKVRSVLKAAIQHLEKAIELDPAHEKAHYYLIQLLINAPNIMGGDNQRARELNERLAELSPLKHRIVNSTLAAKQDDHAAAEALLAESHEAQPQSTLVNFTMLSHYHSREQYDKAIPFGEKFLSLPKDWDDTDLASAHYLLAQAYEQQGEQQQSLHHYALTLTHTENKKLIERVQEEVKQIHEES